MGLLEWLVWSNYTHYIYIYIYICVCVCVCLNCDIQIMPGRRQAIILINTGIWLIWTLGTNFSENLIEIHI